MAVKTALLTTREAAKLLRVSARTLEKWRSKQYGPRPVYVGCRAFYRKESIDSWLDEQEREAFA